MTCIDSNQKLMVLFDPSWGVFDLILGQKITSAYPNPADRDSFPIEKIHLTFLQKFL